MVLLFLDSMLGLVLLVGVGVGVAGWNIESGSWFFLVLLGGFGTLLGPEGTPVLGCFFWLLAWIV